MLVVTVSTALAVVLGWACVAKAVDRSAFASGLTALRVVPRRWEAPAAGAVVTVEGLLSVALLLPPTRQWGLYAAGALLAVFTVVIARLLRRPAVARCGCFGSRAVPVRRWHLVRNAGLVAAAGAGAAVHEVTEVAPAGAPGWWLGCAVGATVGILLVHLDDIVDLFAPSRVGAAR